MLPAAQARKKTKFRIQKTECLRRESGNQVMDIRKSGYQESAFICVHLRFEFVGYFKNELFLSEVEWTQCQY